MATNYTASKKKKTSQGNGKFSKKPSAGGESYVGGNRAGSPPGRSHRKKKPYRGQGK
tara:strand:- start:2076 stop:2246 length:171 start_codon:yes stop_codon:yes gene_type:complete